MADDWVNLVSPATGDAETAAVAAVLASGWLSSGPKVEEFESRAAQLVGTAHAVATSSCTTAQAILVAALDIGPGDEIVTTPLTWPSICAAAVSRGAIPIFADVEDRTFGISPDAIGPLLTERTKAIFVVHFGGVPCEMAPILETAARHGIPVLEDCAHAIGTTVSPGRHVGSMGLAGTFSFGGPKTLTCGEGGLITTNDAQLARRCRILRNSGETATSIEKFKTRNHRSSIVEPSLNYRINELAAAVGCVQLSKLPGLAAGRVAVAEAYRRLLTASGVHVQEVPTGCVPVPFVFPLVVGQRPTSETRDGIVAALRAERVEGGIHYPLVYWRDAYNGLAPADRSQCRKAEEVSLNIVTLPCHQSVPAKRIEDAVGVISSVLAASRH